MKLKKIEIYIQKGIVALLALFSLLTLCFCLLRVDHGNGTLYSENGFNFFAFESFFISGSYDWANKIIGSFSIIMTLFSVVAIILAICNFISFKKVKVYEVIIIAISLFNTIIYFIEGFVFKSVFIETWGIGAESMYIKTSCYIPFIICAVLFIAYIVVGIIFDKIIKTQPEKDTTIEQEEKIENKKEEKQEIETKTQNYDEESKIALLTKYKELLDAGVITQEEFDIKKKEILGL